DPDLSLESDGILDVEAIHRVLAAPRPGAVAAVDGDSVVGRAVLLARAKGGAEVVLGPRTVQARRPGLAVDEDHVVALAVPVVHLALEDVDVEVAADVVAATARVENQVVALAGEVRMAPRTAERQARSDRAAVAIAVVAARIATLARRAGRCLDAIP